MPASSPHPADSSTALSSASSPVQMTVNGETRAVEVDPSTPLLYVLRDAWGLNGPKYGCGVQQCGACIAIIDGDARPTCVLPVSAVAGAEVTTLKGLSDGDDLHPVQAAFVEEQAAQCGYCVNGMVLTAVALLQKQPAPDPDAIREGLRDVLCRCGTYARFERAVQSAADAMASREGPTG